MLPGANVLELNNPLVLSPPNRLLVLSKREELPNKPLNPPMLPKIELPSFSFFLSSCVSSFFSSLVSSSLVRDSGPKSGLYSGLEVRNTERSLTSSGVCPVPEISLVIELVYY